MVACLFSPKFGPVQKKGVSGWNFFFYPHYNPQILPTPKMSKESAKRFQIYGCPNFFRPTNFQYQKRRMVNFWKSATSTCVILTFSERILKVWADSAWPMFLWIVRIFGPFFKNNYVSLTFMYVKILRPRIRERYIGKLWARLKI